MTRGGSLTWKKHAEVEANRDAIISDVTSMGPTAACRKHGISTSGWVTIRRRWIEQGFLKADQIPRYMKAPIAKSVARVQMPEKKIKVSVLFKIIQDKKEELAKSLQSTEYTSDVRIFLRAQVEAFNYVEYQINKMIKSGELAKQEV